MLCFITMPKSGTHMFRHIAELVLDRSTDQYGSNEGLTQSYYGGKHGGGQGWAKHYHGYEHVIRPQQHQAHFHCEIHEPPNKRILYLHRNIPDCVYSWIVFAKYQMGAEITKKITTFLRDYHKHYMNLPHKEVHRFTYEDLCSKPMEILPAVFDFIGHDYTIEGIRYAVNKVTKEEVVRHGRIEIADTRPEYQANKERFMENYGDIMREILSK